MLRFRHYADLHSYLAGSTQSISWPTQGTSHYAVAKVPVRDCSSHSFSLSFWYFLLGDSFLSLPSRPLLFLHIFVCFCLCHSFIFSLPFPILFISIYFILSLYKQRMRCCFLSAQTLIMTQKL